jgi:hypothetical protein
MRESEIGPPPIRFRHLADRGYGSSLLCIYVSCTKLYQNVRTPTDMWSSRMITLHCYLGKPHIPAQNSEVS